MRIFESFALWTLFLIGALVGLLLALPIFLVALLRGGRPFHKDGVVVRAEVIARDERLGPRLSGPAWVRLSGAFTDQTNRGSDVLGLILRLRRPSATASTDPSDGDQDVLFGTFESFRTASRDRAATVATDYLANHYSTVTPYLDRGFGASILRLAPDSSTREAARRRASVSDRRSSGAMASGPDASDSSSAAPSNRLQGLREALAADCARFILTQERGNSSTEIAELRLTEETSFDGSRLRGSMFRAGRDLSPVGFRNGIRAVLYPVSQLGRGLRAR